MDCRMTVWSRWGSRAAVWIVALGLVGAGAARAQDVLGQDAEQNAGQAAGQDSVAATANDSIMHMILDSGATGLAFMVVLVLFSLFAVMVALERAVNTRRSKIVPPGFLTELKGLLHRGDAGLDAFRDLCGRWSAPIANVLNAGVLRAGRPLPEVEKSMEDAAAREMAAVRGGIRPLSVIGAVAPLVGLLGTVLGMIIAFRTASQAGLGKGELMAQGIYMALLTTAAGLTIAIPCLLLAALFNSKVEKSFREIDESLMESMPAFARMEEPAFARMEETA